jgi:curved DNA-binding protein CbpA
MDDFEHLDHYAILGVDRDATVEGIKRAYRQQMTRFHPDRYAGASPEEQAYASQRARRINAAYAALSDFHTRAAYNRSLAAEAGDTVRAAPRAPVVPPTPRDHLAELYEQARAHLAAGRALQAAATLREILQLNPFYRDSAALLTQAEAAAHSQQRPPAPAAPNQGRRALMAGGLGALALIGLGAVGWAMRGRAASATADLTGSTAAAGEAPSLPSAAPPTAVAGGAAPSPIAAPPTAAGAPPSPTAAPPTMASTSSSPPTAAPAPTVSATSLPATLPEDGPLLYADDFGPGSSWPTLGGRGWSVGPAPAGYQIVAAAAAGNIWAYSTAPSSDFLVGVDVAVSGGLAGLLLRFSETGYLAFLVNPALGSYRLARRDGAGEAVLIEEGHSAVVIGPDVVNRVTARLEGEAVALRINGQPVYDTVVSAPPPSARYGLVASADADEVTATFTNLTLRGL